MELKTTGTDKCLKAIYTLLMFVACLLLSMVQVACTQDASFPEADTEHTCRMQFNVTRNGYDTSSRTVREGTTWNDGDCVYLVFLNGAERVEGKAIYNSAESYWALTYNGQLPQGASEKCHAYFFEGDYTEDEETVVLSEKSCVFADLDGAYIKASGIVSVTANLTPISGRIRFTGEKGLSCNLTGIVRFDKFVKNDGYLATSTNGITLNINDNGYSDYLFLMFGEASRTLCVSYDRLTFRTDCEHPILDAGQAGVMALPTLENHNGWTMTRIDLPTLGSTSVADIGVSKASLRSSVTSNGNGHIDDCGFCYSKSPLPTVADMKVKYGVATSDFGCTINSLEENTTYYVRAYATNEVGTGYGAEITFRTLEVTPPALSVVSVGNISNTTADFEAAVTSSGNGTLSDAGFVYSTDPYPTTSSAKISCGKVMSLKTRASNLQPETKYYVRAYATNEKGTNYGEEKSFTTTKTVVNPYTTLTLETSYGYTTLDMAKVEGGTFQMGAQSGNPSKPHYDKDAYSDESPVHQVTLSSYYIGKTEITQKQWYVVMGSYPSVTSAYGLGDDYPVYNVTYDQCRQFISKLSNLTGKKFRLPTEAEWEYAARGGANTSGYKYSGDNTIGNVAWYNNNSSEKTHPTATKNANELNLYDMTGNVWEWCSDWYGNYGSAAQANPEGPASGTGRVIRGGGFRDVVIDSRVSVRSNAAASFKSQTLGIRVVME